MRKVNVIWILLLGLLGACSTEPDSANGTIPGDTTVNPDYAITVSSPAANSSVSVPFSITGTKGSGIAQVVINGGTSAQSATISGSDWTVTFDTNEVNLGMIQFVVNGKDADGNIVGNTSVVLMVEDNGSGAYLVRIYGQLTNNFTSLWKVLAKSTGDTYIGSVDSSTGNFAIPLQSDIGLVKLIAYRDDNGNGVFDDGEPASADQPQITVAGTDISNVYIDIPIIQNYTMQGLIQGNIYHRSLGVAIYNNDSGSFVYGTPSTLVDTSYSLTFLAAENNAVKVYYYFDDNGDNKWNADPVNQQNMNGESALLAAEIGLATLTNTVDIILTGKVIQGSVSGDDASLFDGMRLDLSAGTVYAPVSSGTYTMSFYLMTNSPDVTVTNTDIFVFRDDDGNGQWKAGEGYVAYTNDIAISNGQTVTSNTANFVIKKFTVSASLSGDDATSFKFYYDDLWNSDTRAVQSYTWNSYVYGDGTNLVNLTAFIDQDGNNMPELGTEISFTYTIALSNQSSVSTNYFVKRTTANIACVGDWSAYTSPMIQFALGLNKVYYDVVSSVSLINYWNTNEGAYSATILGFDDLSGDGKKGGPGEGTISTNTVTLSQYVSSTNVTLGF